MVAKENDEPSYEFSAEKQGSQAATRMWASTKWVDVPPETETDELVGKYPRMLLGDFAKKGIAAGSWGNKETGCLFIRLFIHRFSG